MKAVLFGLFGFLSFTYSWRWYYLRPSADKAIAAGAARAVFTANPRYWALAFTAAFGFASLCLMLARS